MALIRCPECNGEVSDTSSVCIHCGYKLKSSISDIIKMKVTNFIKSHKKLLIFILVIISVPLVLSYLVTKENFDDTMDSYYGSVNKYKCKKYAYNLSYNNEYLYNCRITIDDEVMNACFLCRKEGGFIFYKIAGCVLQANTSCKEYINK